MNKYYYNINTKLIKEYIKTCNILEQKILRYGYFETYFDTKDYYFLKNNQIIKYVTDDMGNCEHYYVYIDLDKNTKKIIETECTIDNMTQDIKKSFNISQNIEPLFERYITHIKINDLIFELAEIDNFYTMNVITSKNILEWGESKNIINYIMNDIMTEITIKQVRKNGLEMHNKFYKYIDIPEHLIEKTYFSKKYI